MSVRDIDRGARDLFRRAAELANRVSFGIGVPENAGTYPDGTPVTTVAAAHEFGLGNVPPRSFIRGWYDGHGERFFQERLAKVAQHAVIDGEPMREQLQALGRIWVREVQQRMDAGIAPELQDETVARKTASGSATPGTPLEDTHRLREAIQFVSEGDQWKSIK